MPSQDAFLAAFGWTSAHVQVSVPGDPTTASNTIYSRETGQITDHPAMTGISAVKGDASGAFAASPPGASPLIVMGNGQAGQLSNLTFEPPSNKWVGGTAMFGAGRTAFILDSNFFDSPYLGAYTPGYYLSENRRFALQLIDWLAGGASRDAYPDLVFRPAGIDGPTLVSAGDLVEFATTVMNVGDTIGNAEGVTVRFYDGDPAAGRVIGESKLAALGVDDSQRASVLWDSSHAEGDHVITAVVDPDDQVREFDEQHNVVSLKLRVRIALDLRVDPSDISILPGEPPTVSVRVHNNGYRDCPSGGRLQIQASGGGATLGVPLSADLPAIAARSATTVTMTWVGAFPSVAFTLTASASIPAGLGIRQRPDQRQRRPGFRAPGPLGPRAARRYAVERAEVRALEREQRDPSEADVLGVRRPVGRRLHRAARHHV